MSNLESATRSARWRGISLALFLCLYLGLGIYTELRLLVSTPLPEKLLEDASYYARAQYDALNGGDTYGVRSIGSGYLYPPQALLVVELFGHIQDLYLKAAISSVVNIALLALIVYTVAKRYGHTPDGTWYWYVLALGFAPFLEVLHVGQINTFALLGLCVMFVWEDTSALASGAGLTLAVITKVTPLALLAYLAANRRYKVIASTAVFLIAVTAISILRYGITPLLEYPGMFRWLLTQFPLDYDSQSLSARLFRLARSTEWQGLLSMLPQTIQPALIPASAFLTTGFETIQRVVAIYVLVLVVLSGLLTFLGNQPREPMFILTTIGMMLSPNVLWYHHYLFALLPCLVAMGWTRLDRKMLAWCLLGLTIVQFDRWFPPYGLLIHIFGHVSMAAVLAWQIRQFRAHRETVALPLALAVGS